MKSPPDAAAAPTNPTSTTPGMREGDLSANVLDGLAAEAVERAAAAAAAATTCAERSRHVTGRVSMKRARALHNMSPALPARRHSPTLAQAAVLQRGQTAT